MNFITAVSVGVLGIVAACGDGGKQSADAAVDARPAGSALTHTLFVQFEGATVTYATMADATMDKSDIVRMDHPAALAAFRAGNAGRATEIASVVSELQGLVAAYGIDVVTTRPTAAPYMMLVVTDSNDRDAFTNLGPGVSAITSSPASCNTLASPIALFLAGEFAGAPATVVDHSITHAGLAMFAFSYGVPMSTKADDCMCFASGSCGSDQQACTIGGAGTPVFNGGSCGDTGGTMDEGAKFLAVFGPHA